MAFAIAVIMVVVTALGAYFSHKGMGGKNKPFYRHVFYFFLLNLITRLLGLLQAVLIPMIIDTSFFRATSAFWLNMNYISSFVNVIAYALVVYGCYAGLHDESHT